MKTWISCLSRQTSGIQSTMRAGLQHIVTYSYSNIVELANLTVFCWRHQQFVLYCVGNIVELANLTVFCWRHQQFVLYCVGCLRLTSKAYGDILFTKWKTRKSDWKFVVLNAAVAVLWCELHLLSNCCVCVCVQSSCGAADSFEVATKYCIQWRSCRTDAVACWQPRNACSARSHFHVRHCYKIVILLMIIIFRVSFQCCLLHDSL